MAGGAKYAMHALPPKLLGSSGLPCIFASDDSGTAAVGYVLKQLGTSRFQVTNGSVTKTCILTQTQADINGLPGQLAPGTCTFALWFNDNTEYVKYITETRCTTIDNNVYAWRLGSATDMIGQIVTPTLSSWTLATIAADVDPPMLGITPNAVSNHGLVVGSFIDGVQHPFGWMPNSGADTFDSLVEGQNAAVLTVTELENNSFFCAGIAADADGNAHLVSWRLTTEVTLTDLGYTSAENDLSGVYANSPICVSADAAIIAFAMMAPGDNQVQAAMWNSDTGQINDMPILQAGDTTVVSAMSADGTLIYGAEDSPDGAFAWKLTTDNPTVVIALGAPNPTELTAITGISADKTATCGTVSTQDNSQTTAFYTVDSGQPIELPGLAVDANTSAIGISADGTMICGTAVNSSNVIVPVVWINGAIHELPIAAGAINHNILGMSPNGIYIVGTYLDTDSNTVPAIWTKGS